MKMRSDRQTCQTSTFQPLGAITARVLERAGIEISDSDRHSPRPESGNTPQSVMTAHTNGSRRATHAGNVGLGQ